MNASSAVLDTPNNTEDMKVHSLLEDIGLTRSKSHSKRSTIEGSSLLVA